MFTERVVSCGEVSLNLATSSSAGQPLLLLHGVTRRWQDFLTFVTPLTLRWQVQALDFRGHGRSDRVSGRYRVIDHARDVVAYLRSQPGEPTVIYGHSLGALVAAAVAAELPEAVRAVVLEDPPSPALLRNLEATPYHPLYTEMRALASSGRTVGEIAHGLAELRVPDNGRSMRLGDLRDAISLRFSARCLLDLDADVLTPVLEGQWLEGCDVESIFRAVTCPVLLLRATALRRHVAQGRCRETDRALEGPHVD